MPRRSPLAVDNSEYLEFIYHAAGSAYGIAISTNAPERLRQKLYPLLKKEGISLSLFIPAEPGKLYLVRNEEAS